MLRIKNVMGFVIIFFFLTMVLSVSAVAIEPTRLNEIVDSRKS